MGIAILLVEKSAYTIDIIPQPPPSIETSKDGKKKGDGVEAACLG